MEIYTDGSASPNPGPGGAGAVVLYNGEKIITMVHAGGKTTNNRMELYALIMSYQFIVPTALTTLYTDSQYVQKGITVWIHNWVKNKWVSANKQPVKNADLWMQLYKLKQRHPKVEIKWVKAHAGNKWNEYADKLANRGTEMSKAREK